MRQTFPGHYRPTSDQFAKMWRDCTFAFDANVLLNLYRYRLETRDALFGILGRLQDRIWIPHQAALEYHRNRPSVIASQQGAYDSIELALNNSINRLRTELSQYKRHFTLDVDGLIAPFLESINIARTRIAEARSNHPDLLYQDSIRDRITELFDGRVGAAYPATRTEEIVKLAEKRLAQSVPPGYADRNNKDRSEDQRGDVTMWLQVIDKGCETQRPLIFITDDAKDDWWLIHNGKTLGPRPELIEEMATHGISFYMYSSTRFAEEAGRYLEGPGLGKTDLTKALRDIEAVARERAALDSLTGLYNRRWLNERLEKVINDAENGGPPVALLMIDIDNFKRFNDQLGHQIGDELLLTIASTLSSLIGDRGTVVRFGGEEFAVVLSDITTGEALQLAERVRESIAGHSFLKDAEQLSVTVSIGIASCSSGDRTTINQLIEKAWTRVSRAKALGKNRVVGGSNG